MDDLSSVPAKRQKTEPGSCVVKNREKFVFVHGCLESDIFDQGNIGQDLQSDIGLSNLQSDIGPSKSIASQLLQIENRYNELFNCLKFEHPVANVYNPVQYAYNIHSQFIRKYCQSEKEILFLGINPGPWGMSQTGVPFGVVSEVRDWLGLSGSVDSPNPENPHRPISGLTCARTEASGKRFWPVLREIFGEDPNDVFKNCFVHNYCPLAFLAENGKNITPAELRAHQRHELFRICDDMLVEILLLLNVKTIVAIGRFPEVQAKQIFKKACLNSIKLVFIPHPCPRAAASLGDDWKSITLNTLKKALQESLPQNS